MIYGAFLFSNMALIPKLIKNIKYMIIITIGWKIIIKFAS